MPPRDRVEDAVDGYVRPFVAGGNFAGAVLVARGTRVFSRAYGLADVERGVANEVGTRFRIASLTKMFTAAAVLLLVDRKQISLDATLDPMPIA
jgi:CubicO group peptidase (beta-lactamase class C family)